jgi:uncharacterized UPF0160 family protein
MNKFSEILTHPGSSHKDEFLACSLLVAVHEAPIVRREPTQHDLNNPRIAVVDVGGFHQPEMGNFDHHQFPKDHPPTCSLSLVLMEMGLKMRGSIAIGWKLRSGSTPADRKRQPCGWVWSESCLRN